MHRVVAIRRTASIAALALALAGCGELDLETDCESYAATGNCGGVPNVAERTGPVDALAAYDGQTSCESSPKPGVVAFRDLVLAAYPCTSDSGISRACNQGGTSEHKEGRAWDWGTTPSITASQQLLDWLLATDAQGNRYARARRVGIMYVIFNHKVWKSYQADKGWQTYSGSDAHTDHVHFSFSWAGANEQTSFWHAPTQDAPQPQPVPSPEPTPEPVPEQPSPAPGPDTTDDPSSSMPADPAGDSVGDDWPAESGATRVPPPPMAPDRALIGGDGCAVGAAGTPDGSGAPLALLLIALATARRWRRRAQPSCRNA